MADWRIERLGRAHQRTEFRCGEGPLDDFLHSFVSQYEKRNLGRTYVAVRGDETRVFGYYTLASGALPFETLPETPTRRLPRHPVPVVLLARLAVDRSIQGQGLGERLLVDALERCKELARNVGIYAIEVDALHEKAAAFYSRYGFVALRDNPLHLYLPITSIPSSGPLPASPGD
jgi:GNAT superfamily N-acetyltransferase